MNKEKSTSSECSRENRNPTLRLPKILIRKTKKLYLGRKKLDTKTLISSFEVIRELFCQITSKDDDNTEIVYQRDYAPNSAKPCQN